ncbi:MAG: SPFH domain-containing protein [Peptococcaceae bacterium]|nr:SPFH domain-containing protein [Peptococcaceae bacterium]
MAIIKVVKHDEKIVKYDGSPDTLVWKHPDSELSTWTQLIVNESQEAILFKGGQALDLYAAGRHTLETANIPLLNRIIDLPFGGDSPFTAEVWFINKIHSLDVKWGTPTPIQLQDPKYKVFIPLRSFGQFGIQISDSRKFLVKLVGTLSVFTKQNVVKYFQGLYLTKVKDVISSYLINRQISVLEINAYLDELSEFIGQRMTPVMSDYGIRLVNFYVNDISVPEDDTAVIQLKSALAKKAEMDIVGYNYTQQRSFDALEGAAKNTSSGQAGLMGAGIGLGMGVGVGGAFGNQMAGIAGTINTKETKKCPACGYAIDVDKRFCSSCGYDTHTRKETQEEVVCYECGARFSNKAKYCPECGNLYNPCVYCRADIPLGASTCPLCSKTLPKACPKCNTIPAENMKFCPECGESLARQSEKCKACGTAVEGSPKFCPECGNKL